MVRLSKGILMDIKKMIWEDSSAEISSGRGIIGSRSRNQEKLGQKMSHSLHREIYMIHCTVNDGRVLSSVYLIKFKINFRFWYDLLYFKSIIKYLSDYSYYSA